VLALQGEVTDLQADNVKLYEKIRFLQGFQVLISERSSLIELKFFEGFNLLAATPEHGKVNILEIIIHPRSRIF
jgi:hypothetical protein